MAFGLTAACVAKPDSRKRWDVISTMHPLQHALKPMLEMRTPEHVITNSSFHGLKPLHPNCRKGTGSSLSDKIWNARCETLAQHFGTRIKTALREQRRRKIIVALGHRHDNSRRVDTNEILGEAGKALRAPEQQPKKGPKVLSQCYKGCLGSNRECQLPESR